MVSQDTTTHFLCKTATFPSADSRSLFLYASTYLAHIWSSLCYTGADPRCASSLQFSHAEHMRTQRIQSTHLKSIFAYAGNMSCSNLVTPLLHKSSTKKPNKHFAISKQDSKTHLLSLSINLPIHTCGIIFSPT